MDHLSFSRVIASVGQISTHSPQDVHRDASTTGRWGAGRSAHSGQVSRQAPQAVHAELIDNGFSIAMGRRLPPKAHETNKEREGHRLRPPRRSRSIIVRWCSGSSGQRDLSWRC
jgi:hypothetical protein